MVSQPITLEFKNDLAELEELKRALVRFCRPIAVSKQEIFKLQLAVEEVFVNIISYGFQDEHEHRIRVTLAMENGTLVLDFEDDGIRFNPLEVDEPNFDEPIEDRPVGGLGIHIVKCMMSEIDYIRKGNRNHLTLKKDLEIESAS